MLLNDDDDIQSSLSTVWLTDTRKKEKKNLKSNWVIIIVDWIFFFLFIIHLDFPSQNPEYEDFGIRS